MMNDDGDAQLIVWKFDNHGKVSFLIVDPLESSLNG